MAVAIAKLDGVTKTYGGVTALDRVELSLEAGSVTALLGPNGAGKTTAVRVLLGLTRPTSGTARLFELEPQTIAARRRVGVMLQISKVPEPLTVFELVRLFSSYYDDPMPMETVLRVAGLVGLERRRFGKLSGGERQRLFVALAFCGNPQFIVLDEPTVGLDVESRRAFWREVRNLRMAGRSLLLTTHYIEEADALADRVVILQQGHIVADGTPAAIKARVASRQIRCRTGLATEEMAAIPGVRGVRRESEVVVLLVTDAEVVVRDLLARDPSLTNLEVSSVALEEAFLTLTGRSASADGVEAMAS